MSKLILCRGIQGSGKSTWAKNWVLENPEKRIRINWDDLRNMLGKYWVPSRESIVSKMSISAVNEALKKNFDVVIDNMNLSERSTEDFIKLAEKYNSSIIYQDFKTPLEICIERDKNRDNPIGEDIIRSTYNKYKNFYK